MKKNNLLVRGSALAFVLFGAAPVWAQTETASAGNEAAEADQPGIIVVTGSRIARQPNVDSTVPITSVTAAELVDRGEVSLGDALNQLPSMRATFSQANSTAFIGTAGLNLLDLRGLGTERTLVLVNGRRHVTAQPGNYNVDVNTIPRELLERVDVVTGGNSAIYGSDAVAGVVNFILKKDFEGIRLRGQGGVTQYGDRGSYSLGVVAGKNFGDGRFNITGALEYAKSNSVFYTDRDYLGAFTGTPGFITSQITTAPNRNFDGIPNTSFVDGNPGVTFGNISLGGYVLTSCPLANATNTAQRELVCTGQLTPTNGRINYNYAFLADGTLVRDDPSRGLVDNRAIGGGVLGGLSATGGEGAMLLPGLERYAANLMFNAEISPAFQPFIEAKYVRVTATQQSTQPTFIASTLPATFSVSNPFLTDQARATLASILNPGATTFTMQRFNNDFGTRAEDHKRDTYRVVAGFRGELGTGMNLSYEAAFNYGRTETYYETGGNVHLQRYRNAINAQLAPASFTGATVLNSRGQRVACGINVDAVSTNDDAACVPLNVFGYGAPSKEALGYILHTSSRKQWAEQINAQAFISGNTGSFELPGGPIGFALGAEYRREDAYSAYDAVTQSGATFLNAFQPFEPPALEVKEAFGEVRIPVLADMAFAHELTFEGSGRVSDYGGKTGSVWAYNVGAVWAPIPDIRMRVGYAKSVRAPNLNNLYATAAVTFANGLTDPCDQAGGTNANNNITSNPNRVRNCAAAGVPTSITYTDGSGTTATIPWVNVPGSGVAGINRGNPDLVPEVGKSLTAGVILQPRFVPGLTVSIDYYNIKVENVITGLTGQAIINRCYDDPTGIDNVFCDAVSRRSTPGNAITDATFDGQSSRRLQNAPDFTLPTGGSAFFNQPFNFAALKTSGIDVDASYNRTLGADTRLSLRGIVSYLIRREQFTSITNPDFSTRIHGTLGDPVWAASFNANVDFGKINVGYNMRYVGKMVVSGLSWETFFPHQDRTPTNPDARPFAKYKPQTYHNIRLGFDVNDNFEFYSGVDNLFNNLPPYDTIGNGAIAGDSIYPNTGRFYYAGFQAKF